MPKHQQTQQFTESRQTSQKQANSIIQTPASNPASIIQRAKINPKSLTSADVLQLQRTIGNRAVVRLLSGIKITSSAQQIPIQRQEIPEEEEPLQGMFENKPEKETCPSCMQMQEIPEEKEPLQGKMIETVQRLKIPEEEEKLQMKHVVQKQEISEEGEPIQGKTIGTIQRQEIPDEEELLQRKKENNTGMPDNLKAGVENLSGIDMSDVRVHYNSSKPAEVGALAYTQGTNIHVAPGQERHLPHEAWHEAQQKQGRVQATTQIKNGVLVNDEIGLEREADLMGGRAIAAHNLYTKSAPENTLDSTNNFVSVSIQKADVDTTTTKRRRTTYKNPAINKKRRLAKIGLELAFNDEFTRKYFGDKGYDLPEKGKETVLSQINDYRSNWKKKAVEDASDNKWEIEVEDEKHPQGDEHIFGEFGRTMFKYKKLGISDLYDGDKETEEGMDESEYHTEWMNKVKSPELSPYLEKNGDWWWGLTVDPKVFEIQTKPTSWQVMDITQVNEIMTQSIFERAEDLGLKAEKGFGGGQINVDFATGLGGDYNRVLETIDKLEREKEEHDLFHSSGLEEASDLNGPYIYGSVRVSQKSKERVSAEQIKEEWAKLYHTYKGKICGPDEWKIFITNYIEFLKKYPSKVQRDGDYLRGISPFFTGNEVDEDILHYQALNIGHIGEEPTDQNDPRRIEFRDFRAQKSVDEVLKAIDLAFSVMPDLP